MSSAPTQLGALPPSAIITLQGELITTALQFFLHGLYTTLTFIALYHMWVHKAALPARRGLIAAMLLMFACSNIQVIEQLGFNVIQVVTLGLDPPDNDILLRNIRLSENVFGRLNYFMSDAIVVWRAWVLWEGNVSVRVLLSLCLFGTFVGLTIDMTFGALWLFGNNKFTPTGPRTLVMVLPLVFTNVVSTASIGIKELLDLPKNKKTNIERILVILTESGMIYCLLWIPFLATLETNIDNTAYEIITNLLPQLSAIYPIIIILLVTLEKTHLEHTMTSAVSQSINFVHAANSTTSTTTGPIRLGAGSQTSGADIYDGMKEKSKPALHPTSSVDFVSRDDSPQ
ncbi:hypothetical protein C8F04DRAFT_1084568 [Mycena alexandri]|uniref:Uncharacterized protein n=1 Tax=Mycena alexandri TaxID=1745969 RepID=A0AAD6XCB6_9AGAR|nr:hypothetical protein C8F04DRAFT_1084568 [Mycena alexandri]